MKGHKRAVRQKIASGEMKDDGDTKRPISRSAWEMLCGVSRKAVKSTYVFMYLTALWEHLSRLNSIGELSTLFMGAAGDHFWTR